VADLVLDALLVACVLAVAVGAGLIYVPAGLIVGGALGAAATLYYAKGLARDRSPDSPGT
jgi:hypothetical protein